MEGLSSNRNAREQISAVRAGRGGDRRACEEHLRADYWCALLVRYSPTNAAGRHWLLRDRPYWSAQEQYKHQCHPQRG